MRILIISLTMALFMLSPQPSNAAKKKMSYQDAKKECLTENPSLVGRDLKSCIRNKRR